MLKGLLQILSDMNRVIFLAGSEDQVALVDANHFPLGQRYTFAIADAEGIEPSGWAQARFAIIVLDIKEGLHLVAGVGDVREIHILSGFNLVQNLFGILLHLFGSEEDVLGGNAAVL